MPDENLSLIYSTRLNSTVQQVVIGVSGGVDSAVAAHLLKQQPTLRVQAVFMQNWDDEGDDLCTAVEDFRDASGVCDLLDIPLSSINFSEEYWKKVFTGFLDEYNAGRTPNPDILCNKEIKFKAFLDHAKTLGAEKIATGHYVQSDIAEDGRVRLLRGADAGKDQSYFLHTLSQEQLQHSVFPVGTLQKTDLRSLAHDLNLQVHDKKDSTGICFIGERKFRDFLAEYVAASPGAVVTPDGDRVGEHNGIAFYTIGQRQGLGIGGNANYPAEPWYVADKNIASNELVVVQGHDHPALHKNSLRAVKLHWIREVPADATKCTAKTRYRQQDQECTIHFESESAAVVSFNMSVRAITPGQSIVFYNGEECLGGGIIEKAPH